MKTVAKRYYTPYKESDLQMVGEIVRTAWIRSGLSTRKFCQAVCDRSGNPKALEKKILDRLIKAGGEDGSRGGEFWKRLGYIAPFTWWDEKNRPFTEHELMAIAMGELKLGIKSGRSESDDKNLMNDDDIIPLSQGEMYKLRAIILASGEFDGSQDIRSWLEERELPYSEYCFFVLQIWALEGTERRSTLEKLLPHLRQVDRWIPLEGKDLRAEVTAAKYAGLDDLLRAIRNGNSVATPV